MTKGHRIFFFSGVVFSFPPIVLNGNEYHFYYDGDFTCLKRSNHPFAVDLCLKEVRGGLEP